MSPIFNAFIFLLIIANTAILALDKYPPPSEAVERASISCNYAFTAVFTVEVIIKLIGLGTKSFVKDRFNLFDTFVVIISYIEISLSDGTGSLGALRAFRLMRIFKIFRAGDLRVLIDSIVITLGSIGNYVVLLVLFIYIYALLGMQFFAG